MRRFIKRVQNTSSLYSLWKENESFIVAVSGGPDSLCLLDVLFVLSKKYNFSLHVAHVNYGLRGADSLSDELLVVQRAKYYELPYTIFRPTKKNTSNIEENLRDIRYAFFEKLRAKYNFTAIAVAHNSDDQAETFLMRLLRGSGTAGLSSILPKNGYVVRPLLHTDREEILQYMKTKRLSFRIDKSNRSHDFLRNRIRHHLLPLLEKKYQPNIRHILRDTAELLASDREIIEHVVTTFPYSKTTGGLAFSCRALFADPEVLAPNRLRFLLQTFFPFKNPSKTLIEEIIKSLKSQKSKTQTLFFRQLKLERKGDTVRLLKFPR